MLKNKKKKIENEQTRVLNNKHICKKELYACQDEIINQYIILFEECLKKHSNLTTYRDYGQLAYLNNNFDKSIDLLLKMIEFAEETGQMDQLNSKDYHQLGQVCVEAWAYEKAIEFLSKSIKQDPDNKAAHFDRAIAFFETGAFDLALEDYLLSDRLENFSNENLDVPELFKEALIKNLRQGAQDGLVEFIPSLWNSIYGIERALWADAELKDFFFPADHFIKTAYNTMKPFVEFCMDIDQEKVDGYVDELKNLYQNFNQLSDSERGELVGYTIGKYGIEIFAGASALKCVNAYQNLRQVNRICNMESMLISNARKESFVASSLKHTTDRDAYFKNVKIHWDRQNKHIPGKHNYEPGKGIITLEPIEFEVLVKKHVGTGIKVAGSIGEAGLVERVDFGQNIGKWALEINGEIKYFPTTKGIIEYAKDGKIHVMPSDPDAIIPILRRQ